ncbi:MAG TPA: hypothetical protein VKB38_09455 [Terracidiphilus sp.]|nr:hypothetical protein [Terracidiphilus sp.]
MIPCRFVLSLLAFAMAPIVPAHAAAFTLSPQPNGQYGQQGGWDAPPREFNDIQRRGFRDGVEGARHDFGNNRRPDVNNRDEYRHPDSIPPGLREAYRDAFRRGYNVAASHLWSEAPPPVVPAPVFPAPAPPPPPRSSYGGDGGDDWGARGLRSDAERQGYREGSQEARKDYQFQRRPDPDDHEEYRNPYVAAQFVDEYREGFMRGYEVQWSQLSGERSWQNPGDPSQWNAPDRFTDMQRQGFRDGIQGAQRDFGNHRRPDPNNRDEYRNPNVPSELRGEYREGFRRGYEMAATRLWGGM